MLKNLKKKQKLKDLLYKYLYINNFLYKVYYNINYYNK